jgi:hypothetical protein
MSHAIAVKRLFRGTAAFLFLIPGVLVRATEGRSVTYELLDGSRIVDDCIDCDRIPIERPLAGTFVLTEVATLPPRRAFEVTAIDFQDVLGEYAVSGSGMYWLELADPLLQEMDLTVAINGVTRIRLRSGIVPVVLLASG